MTPASKRRQNFRRRLAQSGTRHPRKGQRIGISFRGDRKRRPQLKYKHSFRSRNRTMAWGVHAPNIAFERSAFVSLFNLAGFGHRTSQMVLDEPTRDNFSLSSLVVSITKFRSDDIARGSLRDERRESRGRPHCVGKYQGAKNRLPIFFINPRSGVLFTQFWQTLRHGQKIHQVLCVEKTSQSRREKAGR